MNDQKECEIRIINMDRKKSDQESVTESEVVSTFLNPVTKSVSDPPKTKQKNVKIQRKATLKMIKNSLK